MNKKFKFLTVLLALVMTLGAFAPFGAVKAAEATETESVTIHKILQTKENLKNGNFPGTKGLDGTEYIGKKIEETNKPGGQDKSSIASYFGAGSEDIGGVYFAWAKKDKDGKYYWIKSDGNFTSTKTEVNESELDKLPTDTLGEKTLKDSGIKFTTTNFKGEYKIYEIHAKSIYKGTEGELLAASKAVPVEITLPIANDKEGIVKDAHVYPKNTQEKPEIDKNFAANNDLGTVEDKNNNQKSGAAYENYQKEKATVTADLGKKIPYEVKTKIKKDSHYKKLVWNDNMTKGLTYQKDLAITSDQLTGDNALKEDDYFVTETDRGFTLVLKESGLTKVENAAKTADVEIKLTYSAKINGEAVVDKPELNDIALDYANKPGKDNEPKEFTPGKKEIKMKKSWDVTGDQTITEADKNVVAYFTLQKKNDQGKWEDVETVEKTEKDAFTVIFKDLDENGTYRIVESVKGYEADYQKYNPVTGEIEIVDHKDTDNPEKLNPTEPKVQLGGRKFVKTNNEDKTSDKLERLAGAEFYVKNADGKYLVAAKKPFTPKDKDDKGPVANAKAELDAAVKAYNELSAEDQKGKKGEDAKKLINDKQDAYNKAFVANATEYTWGAKDDPNVVVLTSDAEGRFEIKGLAYAKDYKLEEKTAPKGFAKLQSDEKFEVKDGSYASTDAELQYNKDNADAGYGLQIKNKNVTIPQTGGIGTVIFTVVGVMLMVGAAFALKRRKEDELEGLA